MASHTDTIRAGLNIVAKETAGAAERIPRALTVLADNTIGLSSRGSGTGSDSNSTGDISDPTFSAHGRKDQARDDRRRIDQLTRDMLDASRRLNAVLDRYDPPAALEASLRGNQVTHETMWCVNHKTHGHNEPRGSDGSINCRWCMTTLRDHGRLPTTQLIDARYRTTRLSDADYKRLLKNNPR